LRAKLKAKRKALRIAKIRRLRLTQSARVRSQRGVSNTQRVTVEKSSPSSSMVRLSGFRLKAGFNSTDKSSANRKSNSLTTDSEPNYQSVPMIGIDLITRNAGGIGMQTGVSYDFQRKLENDESQRLSILALDIGMNYSMNRDFYFTSGLNLSRPLYSNMKMTLLNESATPKAGMGLGYQVALGYQNSSGFGLEFGYRLNQIKSTYKFSSDEIIVKEKFKGFNVVLNFLF